MIQLFPPRLVEFVRCVYMNYIKVVVVSVGMHHQLYVNFPYVTGQI